MEETMRRITADEVVNAYQALDIAPVYEEWATYLEDGTPCACGLTAVYLKEKTDGSRDAINAELLAFRQENLEDGLGLTEDYIDGFAIGFDHYDNVDSDDWSDEKQLGFQDGRAIREHLDKEGVEWA